MTVETDSTEREIRNRPEAGPEAFTLVLRRQYDAPIEDVWDACTDPDRLNRWFLPVTGDLREGGSFQLEGNAGGEIRRCVPPRLLRITWQYGDRPPDDVELRLQADDDSHTTLVLEHATLTRKVEVNGRMVDVVLNDAETGIWGLGTGWELGLIGLDQFLHGAFADVPARESFDENSTELLELADRCGAAWAEVVERSVVLGQDQG